MAAVVLYKDIHVTPRPLLVAQIRAEEPSLQDGLGLEVVGNPLLHNFGTHRQQYLFLSANIGIISEICKFYLEKK